MAVNSRLRWIIRDGREFFLIWNQGVDTADNGFRGTRGEVTAKAVWTFRF